MAVLDLAFSEADIERQQARDLNVLLNPKPINPEKLTFWDGAMTIDSTLIDRIAYDV